MAYAVGRMGLSLETYLELTPQQFMLVFNEWKEQKQADFEANEKMEYQVARWQVWRTLCPPAKKSVSQFDLIELPGDTEIQAQLKNTRMKTKGKKVKVNTGNELRFRYLAEKWKSKPVAVS